MSMIMTDKFHASLYGLISGNSNYPFRKILSDISLDGTLEIHNELSKSISIAYELFLIYACLHSFVTTHVSNSTVPSRFEERSGVNWNLFFQSFNCSNGK